MATLAYRGYLIRTSPYRDDCWIEKDSFLISASQPDVEHARAVIDQLLEG